MRLFNFKLLLIFVIIVALSYSCKKEEIQTVQIKASFRGIKSAIPSNAATVAMLVNCKYYVMQITATISGTPGSERDAVTDFLQDWADEVVNRAHDTHAEALAAFNAYNNGASSYATGRGFIFTATGPQTDPIIEDCSGTYVPPVPGPGAGVVVLPPLAPSDTLGRIMLNNNLTAAQLVKLKTMLSNFLSGHGNEEWACIHKQMYRYMVTNNLKFNFMMNSSNLVPQTYNPTSSTFTFMNDDAFDFTNIFQHEFFHGFQDMFIGTDSYAVGTVAGGYPDGYTNIEFEAALFGDMLKSRSEGEAFMNINVPQSVRIEYDTWLDTITSNNTKYPRNFDDFQGKYNYFLKKFKLYSGYADKGEILLDMKPLSLLHHFSTSPCK